MPVEAEPNYLLVGIILGALLQFIIINIPMIGAFLFLIFRNKATAEMITFNPAESQVKYYRAPIKQDLLSKQYLRPGSVKGTYRIDITTGMFQRNAPQEIDRSNCLVLEGDKYPLILNNVENLDANLFAIIRRKEEKIESLQDEMAVVKADRDRLKRMTESEFKDYITKMEAAVKAVNPYQPAVKKPK